MQSVPLPRYHNRVAADDQSEPARRAARIRALLENSDALISKSRELRERSQTLLQDNADMREFLRESILNIYVRRERSD